MKSLDGSSLFRWNVLQSKFKVTLAEHREWRLRLLYMRAVSLPGTYHSQETKTPAEVLMSPPLYMTDHRVPEKVKEFTFFTILYDTCAESQKCCMCCGFVWASLESSSFPDPKKSLVHIKATAHLVLSRGRGQVDTRGLHFGRGDVRGVTGNTEMFTTLQGD